jgi:hypothetical protein
MGRKIKERGWPVCVESTEDLAPDFWDVVELIADVDHDFLINSCSENIHRELHITLDYAKEIKRIAMHVYEIEINYAAHRNTEIG